MKQIQVVCSLLKETVTAIMMLYKHVKAMVCLPDCVTDFFDNIAGVLLEDSLARCPDYILRRSIYLIKEEKKRSGRYTEETMTDADCADDLVLLTNTSVQAESLLHSLEKAARGFHVNAGESTCVVTRRLHLLFRWQASEISKAVHIPRQQYLIFWKLCQYTHRKGVDC